MASYANASQHDKTDFLSRNSYPSTTPMITKAIKLFKVIDERTHLLGGIDFLTFSYKSLDKSKYFVFFNLKSDGFDEDVLKESSITIKPYSSINILPTIYSGRVKINKFRSPTELTNDFIYQHKDASFSGHEHHEVMLYFERFHIIKVDFDSVFFNERTSAETALYILSNHIDICNSALWDKRNHYEKFIFSNDYSFLRYAGLLSLTSHHLTHSFLEIYKCFEHIYALPRCLDLKANLNPAVTNKAIELEAIVFNSLGWERKERDSINRLFSKADDNILSDDSMKSIIYKYARASVVKVNGLSFDDWDNIIAIKNDVKIKKDKLTAAITTLESQRKQCSTSYEMVKKLDTKYTRILVDVTNVINSIKLFASNYIYTTRCNIAHLGDQKDIPTNNKEWVELITISITVAESIFSKYRHELI